MTPLEPQPRRRWRSARLFAGVLCLLLGLALIVLLGTGLIGPQGMAGPALVAVMPSVAIGLAVFAFGLWLLATARPR